MIKCIGKPFLVAVPLMLSAFLSTTIQADSSVWKVSKNNDYIFIGGTVHILPPSAFPLPEEFEYAYNKTHSIALETKLPDQSDTAFQKKMMQQMTYENGDLLMDFISAQTHQELSRYVKTLGADLALFEQFKPGFLMTMLAMLEAEKAQLFGEGVDTFYSTKANTDKKPITYFEEVSFQLNMMANMGAGDEERFIKSSLSQMKDFKTLFTGLLTAWRTGNEQQLYQLAIKPMVDDPKTINALLIQRNKNWVPHIERMFKNDSHKEFVLVGVAHLVGRDSVLALLKAQGYTIEKI
jgi:hypothetical protein